VARKVREKGIIEISRKDFFASQPNQIGTLIITAHGVEPEIYKIAQKKKIKIIDTTCPKVIKVQRLAQTFTKRGYEIILVGDQGHKEVEGINAWGDKKAKIVSNETDLEKIKFSKDEKIVVLSQTTQDEKFFQKVAQFVKRKFPQAKILSTLCQATHERQEEIRQLAHQNDAVIVIGSPTSANSNRLYEIAHQINPRSYFIENAEKIKSQWIKDADTIAVTAGASTPKWVIKEVMKLVTKIVKN